MSHPPETSLKLAERIRETLSRANVTDEDRITLDEAQAINCALIDAWVRVRELKAQYRESQWWHQWQSGQYMSTMLHDEADKHLAQCESALVTARKQLEEKY